MRLHRFILDVDLSERRLTVSDREVTNQVINVFRMGAGDSFVICDGKGQEATVEIAEADTVLVVDVGEQRAVDAESATRTILYCAMLKRENFELVVQKATECGVAEIVPVVTARTVKLGAKLDRLQKIAREAAEQSGRGIVPVVHEPMSLKAAIAHAAGNASNVAFEIGAPALVPSRAASTGVFVGPEGGWDDGEVDLLRGAGYHVAGLGPRVLRAETAAIVASFIVTSYV